MKYKEYLTYSLYKKSEGLFSFESIMYFIYCEDNTIAYYALVFILAPD